MRKFGWWIEDVKKRPHQELSQMMGAGWAERLLKAFNKVELPCTLFTIFSTNAIDFVGGYALYQFLKKPLFNGTAGVTQQLSALALKDQGIEDGQQVHELMFESGKVKVPSNWIEILAYF